MSNVKIRVLDLKGLFQSECLKGGSSFLFKDLSNVQILLCNLLSDLKQILKGGLTKHKRDLFLVKYAITFKIRDLNHFVL